MTVAGVQSMPTRRLGNSLTVSAVGFGSLALTGGYGPVEADTAVAVVRHALDLGLTLLDTADFYGAGAVERLIGRAIAGRRGQAVVATRGGAVFTDATRPTRFDGSPDFLRRSCDASLGRLGVDRIDLYTLARRDPEVPIEDSVGGLAELVAAGKIAHIGLSDVTPADLVRANGAHPITAVQCEYSLWNRSVETDLLPAAQRLGVGVIAHMPLGRGFLTGAIRSADQLDPGDYRRREDRFGPAALARDRQRLAAVQTFADHRGLTTSQMSLSWLLHQGPSIVPIPGSRSPQHLTDNAVATSVNLSTADMAELAGAFDVSSL